MEKGRLIFLFLVGIVFAVSAGKIDTVTVHSKSMNKDIQVVIVSPDRPEGNSPVVYLLHGYSGNAKSWINIKPDLPETADRDGLVFVCPDGKNSWYWDSPIDPSSRYETFISKELVAWVDANYDVRKDRSGRAITGLSMGGHGALWIACRHTDTFGAAGSTSGGVDIRPFPENWEMNKQLGNIRDNRENWERHTVINQVDQLKNNELTLIIDCGYDDFFYKVNQDLHNKLLLHKINHEFHVRPGVHNSDYWRNSIDYQILFFKKFFDKKINRINT